MATWVMWVVVAGLLLARGLLAAIEMALQGVSDSRAKELARASPRRGSRLVRMRTERERTAAALRSGMVLAGFSAVAIATQVPPRLLDAWLGSIDQPAFLHDWLTPLTTALLVALSATLVDVTFRSAAAQKPEPWAMSLSWLGAVCLTMLSPLVRALVVPLNLLLRPFGARVAFTAPPPPLEELEKLLALEAQKQEIDKGAPQLIRSIFELSDKTCRDVMVPRTDVVAIDINTPTQDILGLISEENHSRIPVYRDDIDHIVGILHVRDLVPLLQSPNLIVLQDLVRPAAWVPWVKPIGDLLRDMQKQRIHMAVVVDEYGGFSGIVTLEDILREIVGDIGDEFERQEKAFEKQPDGSFLVDALVPREEFARSFEFRFPEGDFETLGGYLSHLAGSIPEVGDRFVVNGWSFIVHSKDGPRLERVRVIKPKPPPMERRNSREIEIVQVPAGATPQS